MFAPEFGAGAARAGDLAKEWCRAGHHVTILTGFPNYPTGKRFNDFEYGNRLSPYLKPYLIKVFSRNYTFFSIRARNPIPMTLYKFNWNVSLN